LRAEPDPHHGPAPELRGGDTIAADRNVALDDVRLAAHYGLKLDIAPRPKSAIAEVDYALAANKSHRPGNPLRSYDPRAENFNPAPATKSVTILETQTSFG
jgi:hypothetical protein